MQITRPSRIIFLNYESFDNINIACSSFLYGLNKSYRMKNVRDNNSARKWFDKKVVEKTAAKNQLFKRLKVSSELMRNIIVKMQIKYIASLTGRSKSFDQKRKENLNNPCYDNCF